MIFLKMRVAECQMAFPFGGVDFEDTGELHLFVHVFHTIDSASCIVNSEEYLEYPDGVLVHPLLEVGEPMTPD
jgi:hypothetical protein